MNSLSSLQVAGIPEGPYKTAPLLALELGITRQTIYGWCRRNKNRLKAYRVGSNYRIFDADWQDFIKTCNARKDQ